MTTVKELMHAGVETHAPSAPISIIARTMKEKDIGAVPITDNGQLVGIVTDRDIAVRALADGRDATKLSAKDVMTKNVACCQATDTARAAARLMEERQVRRLPVLDAKKKLIGMVSLGDLAQAASAELSGKVVKAVSAHHP
jgi:CBS domain-containing protein